MDRITIAFMKEKENDIEYILEHLRSPEKLSEPDFQNWLEEDSHFVLFEEIRNQREAFLRYEDWGNIRVDKEYLRFKAHRTNVRNKRYLWWGGIAASVGVMLGCMMFWLTGREPVPELASGYDEFVGKKNAILILSDGKQINLKNHKVEFYEKNGTCIVNDTNGQLAYWQDTGTVPKEAEVVYHTLSVPSGADYILSLTDGTRIHLNCGSEFRFPVTLSGTERKVFLSGEAFFEVHQAKDWPFIVVTDEMEIRVTGTRFNVKSYREDNFVSTTLVEGAVSISSDHMDRDNIRLEPSQQFKLEKNSGKTELSGVDVSLYTGWVQGMFVFKNQRLEEVMNELARWYSVKVTYIHHSVKNLRLSANLGRYEHIDTLLQIIEAINKIKVERKGDVVMLDWK